MTPQLLHRLQAACKQDGLRTVGTRLGLSPATLSLVLRGKYMASTDRIEAKVQQHLPEPRDAEWIEAWRAEARRTTQAQAAELVGVSEATLSQVFSGNYKAATTRIERRVRGELLGSTCACPVMGEVSTRICQDVQERQPPIANPQHAQAFFACRGRGPYARAGACPHFNGASKAATPKE